MMKMFEAKLEEQRQAEEKAMQEQLLLTNDSQPIFQRDNIDRRPPPRIGSINPELHASTNLLNQPVNAAAARQAIITTNSQAVADSALSQLREREKNKEMVTKNMEFSVKLSAQRNEIEALKAQLVEVVGGDGSQGSKSKYKHGMIDLLLILQPNMVIVSARTSERRGCVFPSFVGSPAHELARSLSGCVFSSFVGSLAQRLRLSVVRGLARARARSLAQRLRLLVVHARSLSGCVFSSFMGSPAQKKALAASAATSTWACGCSSFVGLQLLVVHGLATRRSNSSSNSSSFASPVARPQNNVAAPAYEPKPHFSVHKGVTVLFADISGYTALAQTLGAAGAAGTELLSKSLDDFFGIAITSIYRFNGESPARASKASAKKS
jgi:hypothetical protein